MDAVAISIPTSGDVSGVDGPWYTFPLRLGQRADTIFVLPSTSARQVLTFLPEACYSEVYGLQNNESCPDSRGGTWDPDDSSTYTSIKPSGDAGAFALPFISEDDLDVLQLPILLGDDTIDFGISGARAPLTQQLVASTVAQNVRIPDFGLLPLSPFNATPTNYSDTRYSVVGALMNETKAIPNAFWAYNAGAPYRESPGENTFGSLTLGGYDSSRGNTENVLSVPIQEVDTFKDLVLAIKSIGITTTSSTEVALVSGLPIPTFIDSTVPEIWLPESSCLVFEQTLGIVWNSTISMYLVNESQHDSLVALNPNVTFTLAANTSDSATIDITLPYGSFDLNASWPYLPDRYSNWSRYFPLKRAANASQYYLGRTFLQEAYLTANYDPNVFEFNVSQATFSGVSPNLITVHAVSTGGNDGGGGGLSAGAIAGIVIGVIALLVFIGIGGWAWKRRQHDKSIRRWALTVSKPPPSEGATSTTLDISDQQFYQTEHYKPTAGPMIEDEPSSSHRIELDATNAVLPAGVSYERVELPAGSIHSAASLRRTSDQSRASRPSISPLDQQRTSSRFGHFSRDSGHSSPPTRYASPAFGQESPPLWDKSPSPGHFELHGHSRGPSDASVFTMNALAEQEEPKSAVEPPGVDTTARTRAERGGDAAPIHDGLGVEMGSNQAGESGKSEHPLFGPIPGGQEIQNVTATAGKPASHVPAEQSLASLEDESTRLAPPIAHYEHKERREPG